MDEAETIGPHLGEITQHIDFLLPLLGDIIEHKKFVLPHLKVEHSTYHTYTLGYVGLHRSIEALCVRTFLADGSSWAIYG